MAAAARRQNTFQLVEPPETRGVGVFSVSQRSKTSFYTFWPVPCEIGGEGFAVHRVGLGPLYHVRIGTMPECSCECLGFLRHGQCKHIRALLALRKEGQI